MTLYHRYRKHSTGSTDYDLGVHICSKFCSNKSVLTVCSYIAQCNAVHTYGRETHWMCSVLVWIQNHLSATPITHKALGLEEPRFQPQGGGDCQQVSQHVSLMRHATYRLHILSYSKHQETHVINEHSFLKHILSSLGNKITDDMSSNVSVIHCNICI